MSGPVKVDVFGRTDVGKARDHNEDSFLVADLTGRTASLQPEVREHLIGRRGSLFMVADGMGGAAAGEVASDMATTTVFNHMITQWGNDQEVTEQRFAYRLKEAVEIANQQITSTRRPISRRAGWGRRPPRPVCSRAPSTSPRSATAAAI